ncbi:cytochrome o ubiquinol oxidase subunit IV [Pseudomonas sp. LRF_L74]|uniref:cytochrome o ubiquinol oxidase subunit IV n=1 Tax=Pseudomonas sp. LRF_L74 TaxID=3369422 RepID=UPI003F62E952
MAHDHHSSAGASHGSTKDYVTGFVLSVILTVIPFALVMHPVMPQAATLLTVVGLAVVQIFVHLVYFLHMNTSSEQRWNTVAFVFTVLITIIVVALSIWIIWSMHHYMMTN